MKRSTLMIVALCAAGAALAAASRQPARLESGVSRSAIDGMLATENSLVRRETAAVGQLQSTGGPQGSTTIQASIVRASSDRLVTSKYAYGVRLTIGGQGVTLDVAQAQRLIETLDRVEAARAEQPAEPFEAATVTFKDPSGIAITAHALPEGASVALQLRDAGATLESLRPLRDLLAGAVQRINALRQP